MLNEKLSRRGFLTRGGVAMGGIFLAPSVLAVCGGETPAPSSGKNKLEVTQVDIWGVRDPQEAAQIALAKELGYYKDEGLDVTVKWTVSGTDVPSLAASGQIKMYGESAFTTAILRDKDVDIWYLMRTSDISNTQAFVLGPNTKISSPKDLEGKKVGMAAGSGVGVAIANMAKDHGVDYKKIQFVNLQPPDQAPALTKGDIDAMACWEPWVLAGTRLGGKIYFTGSVSYIGGAPAKVNWLYLDSGLNATGDFVKQAPNTVKAVMRALIRTTDYINADVDKAADKLSQVLQVPAADLKVIMKENNYSPIVDQHSIDGLTALFKWGADLKYVSKVMDPKEVMNLSLLKEVKPSAVQV
jgi:ABC-type nitrate/sulfonate/bicarbonate transport system substrate-binding protein